MNKIKRQLEVTKDGSHTLYVPELDEHYHSVHGAVQEAMHVYLDAGFHFSNKDPIRILEIGFGTGLNAYLTLIEGEKSKRQVEYHSIELYPIEQEHLEKLNYPDQIDYPNRQLFYQMHQAEWNKTIEITPGFHLHKIQGDLTKQIFDGNYDVVYFDAFAPDIQPELWKEEVFQKIHDAMAPDSILTTYSTKGIVKRALRATGFKVKRLPGPPGKREMLRALWLKEPQEVQNS
ncbi:MAG: tRNA (5-methylaminomethyl-2-thiouridine)(34)-methyltransferase MnmD [Marinifilaceae bacterium]